MFNFLASYSRRATVVNAVVSVAVAFGMGSAAADSDDALKIEAVSNRADLVSGGDVLLRVTLPRKQQGTLSVNGAAVPGALHAAPDGNGYLALVTGAACSAPGTAAPLTDRDRKSTRLNSSHGYISY